ncbi:MAG: oligosaccharide repeat unit polymerase [Pseudomonadota bacterium]|nr:oligosaccharide repeat unit polymerase [Pseudomonadota bacterium]
MYDIVLVVTALIYIGVCIWFARSGCVSVYHPLTLFLAMHGFLFVFRAFMARVFDYHLVYSFYEFTPTESDKITALLVATLGMVSFAFFCLRAGNVVMRFNQDEVSTVERRQLIWPFLAVAGICFPIGFYSLLNAWGDASQGTLLASMAVDRHARIFINTQGNGYFKEAQLMLATCGAMLAWLFRFRLLSVLPLATFFVMRAGVGSRGPFVAGAAALGLLWLYDRRQRLPSPRILLGLALIIAVFNVVGEDRGRFIRQALGDDQTAGHNFQGENLKPLEGMDSANLEYLEYIIYVVPQRSHTYSWFTEQLQLFTEPVPRALWPSKPIGAPIKLFEWGDYGNPWGMTFTVPGVGWTGAGWFGVIFYCGLWGYGLGWIYRKYAEGPQSAFQTMAYMVLLSSLIVAFRDGLLLTVARQNIFFMFPILLWLVFARVFGLRSAADVRRVIAARRGMAAAALPRQSVSGLPPAVLRRRAVLAAEPKA